MPIYLIKIQTINMRTPDRFVSSPAKRSLDENPNYHEKDNYTYGIRTQEIHCVIQISMALLTCGIQLHGEETHHRHPMGWLCELGFQALGSAGHLLPESQHGFWLSILHLPVWPFPFWGATSFSRGFNMVTILIWRLEKSCSHLLTHYLLTNWFYIM